MMELVKYNAVRKAIAEAKSIDELKDIRDKAEAMRLYAKQRAGYHEAQNQCAELKIRAEIGIGEILAEQINHEGGRPSQNGRSVRPLSDYGLNKSQSSRWQLMARLPEDIRESHIAKMMTDKRELTSASLLKLAKREDRKNGTEPIITSGDITLHHADASEFLPTLTNESIDAIITDPPYPKGYLHLYEMLAVQSARLLKPGGSLLAMCGQSYLPEIFNLMTPHIDYQWTLSYQTPGGQSPQVWTRNVNTFWKPVLWFVKGEYTDKWQGDVVKSDANDKDFHHWGQSESGFIRLIENFSKPNETILDPFIGGGTTAVVGAGLGRNVIGIDIDKEAIVTTKKRLGYGL